MSEPCPTCAGPSRETADGVCQTCGTSYRSSTLGTAFPPLRPEHAVLHVCLTCGAAVPLKAIAFHDDWHAAIASAAIEALGGGWSRKPTSSSLSREEAP